MNRIIIIGNGFDLAHGLKTSYKDFIDSYWKNLEEQLLACEQDHYEDDLCFFRAAKPSLEIKSILSNVKECEQYKSSWLIIRNLAKDPRFEEVTISPFLDEISLEASQKNWVDIETAYYERLFKSNVEDAALLNHHLSLIKDKLVAYLSNLQQQFINESLIKDDINKEIYAPILGSDIAVSKYQLWVDYVKDNINLGVPSYRIPYSELSPEIDIVQYDLEFREQREYDKQNILDRIIQDQDEDLLEKFASPESIMLLNFNYTNTADLYSDPHKPCEINHIHGEISHPEHIIFGYGDENDESFKDIMSRKNNEYLKNVKSTNYTETNHYRHLLSFMQRAPYQLYIMGHSCGQSDGTLLHTLFEHPNCVSIKPYYYIKDGQNKYIETVQNIYRNFTNMQLMRELVVCRDNCKPLCKSQQPQ